MEHTIYVNVPKAKVHQLLQELPAIILHGGHASDAMMQRTGSAVQQIIRDAFVVKSRGGTDAAGDRWRPLSPKTVAYKRKHPGLPSANVRAAFRPSYALSHTQRAAWWAIYRRMLAKLDDKAHAAAIAWSALKRKGVVTLLDRYGGLKVDILNNSGELLASLSPHSNSADQVFRVHNGTVTLGTRKKGALQQNKQRRLWPVPQSWPSSWNEGVLIEARRGLLDLVVECLTR